MAHLDSWDWAILAVAGYVAVLSLVQLMRTHHDVVVGQLREKIQQEGSQQRRQQPGSASGKDMSGGTGEERRTDVA